MVRLRNVETPSLLVSRRMRTFLYAATLALGLVFLAAAAACRPAPANHEAATVPERGFNLSGTWEWRHQDVVPSGCLLRLWEEGSSWSGWIIQDLEMQEPCSRLDYRLYDVAITDSKVSLWFRIVGPQNVPMEMRFEVVTPSVLRAINTVRERITLVKKTR